MSKDAVWDVCGPCSHGNTAQKWHFDTFMRNYASTTFMRNYAYTWLMRNYAQTYVCRVSCRDCHCHTGMVWYCTTDTGY